jgi:hypothetical protein
MGILSIDDDPFVVGWTSALLMPSSPHVLNTSERVAVLAG